MRIISRKALRIFWEEHPDTRQALQAWYADVKHADWKSPAGVGKDCAAARQGQGHWPLDIAQSPPLRYDAP